MRDEDPAESKEADLEATSSEASASRDGEGELIAGERRPFVIVGATATGKSDLGMTLAETLGGEIINADALQVYRGLSIGTAKPSIEEQQRIPHHLIDIYDPHERYSAGEFARRAKNAIRQIQRRERTPIIVGGSGLYIRALLEGISPIPPGDPVVREHLRERLASEGLEVLKSELFEVDPTTAVRLGGGDQQRILRALEVHRVTGARLSDWIARKPFGESRLKAIRIGLTLPRRVLYDRIERRVSRMVNAGWVQEVQGLLAEGVPPDAPAFQAIGYRQLVRFVEGEWSLEDAMDETVRATRRFAKRQETWFRKESGVRWFPAQDIERHISTILELSGVRYLGRAHGET